MDSSHLRQKLAAGEVLVGLYNAYPAAAIIETIGRDWDFIWIDGQHGQLSYDATINAVRAADAVGTDTLLRVPSHDPGILGLHADMHPSALMVPIVNTAQKAMAVVDAVRFPPLGNRSYGGRRPIDFLGRGYYQNHDPVMFLQIETAEAVERADEIAAVDGVDGLFLGTDDLKMQLDISVDTPNSQSKPIVEATRRVVQAARGAGKFAGAVAASPEAIKQYADLGYQLLNGGGDVMFLRMTSASQLQALREALK